MNMEVELDNPCFTDRNIASQVSVLGRKEGNYAIQYKSKCFQILSNCNDEVMVVGQPQDREEGIRESSHFTEKPLEVYDKSIRDALSIITYGANSEHLEELHGPRLLVRDRAYRSKRRAVRFLKHKLEQRLIRQKDDIKKRAHHIWKKLQAREGKRFLHKMCYIVLFLHVIMSSFCIGKMPEFYYIWHTVQYLVLIIIRFIVFRLNKWHYYMFDFCYYANLLVLIYLFLLPNNLFMWHAIFGFNGMLGLSILLFTDSLVPHSLQRVTSAINHYSPLIVMWTVLWFPKNTNDFVNLSSISKKNLSVSTLFHQQEELQYSRCLCNSDGANYFSFKKKCYNNQIYNILDDRSYCNSATVEYGNDINIESTDCKLLPFDFPNIESSDSSTALRRTSFLEDWMGELYEWAIIHRLFKTEKCNSLQSCFTGKWFFAPFLAYIIWSGFYSLKMFVISPLKIESRNYMTLYKYMAFDKGFLLKLPVSARKYGEIVFMLCHFCLFLLGFLLVPLIYSSFFAHTFFIIFFLILLIYNGANFYIDFIHKL